jgi:hypothetical protein
LKGLIVKYNIAADYKFISREMTEDNSPMNSIPLEEAEKVKAGGEIRILNLNMIISITLLHKKLIHRSNER